MDNYQVDFEKSLGALKEMLNVDDGLDMVEMSNFIKEHQALSEAVSARILCFSSDDIKKIVTLSYRHSKLMVALAEKYGIEEA